MKMLLLLIGLTLLAAGPATLLAPDMAATAYGIAADSIQARVYLNATAIRDVALGGWLLALLALGASRRLLSVSMLAIALVALGDAVNVSVHAGWHWAPALTVHLGGLGLLLGLGLWLWRAKPK